MMRSDLALYLVTGVCLILLVLLTHWCWSRSTTAPATPKPTRRKREPNPFAGYTRKPECERCEHEVASHPQLLGAPPPRLTFTRGRRRQVDTSGHFCPHTACAYHGRVDFGNIRANGHPNGRCWRQLVCLGCAAISSKPWGCHFTPSTSTPTSSCGPLQPWLKGSASVPSPASLRWTRTRF